MAAHTGSDVPLSALGAGAGLFSGVADNTEIFFRMMQAAIGGAPGAGAARNDAPIGVPANSASPPSQRTAVDRISNLSSRGLVGAGADAMINGFVLSGSQTRRLLIRGIGPALGALGVTNALVDPILLLRDSSGTTLASNDNWETNDNAAAVREAAVTLGAFALAPGSRDAALLIDLPPGSYTVQLGGGDGGTGTGLLEIYELP
jgi:hypothetical protein